jgi:hypothetical protein
MLQVGSVIEVFDVTAGLDVVAAALAAAVLPLPLPLDVALLQAASASAAHAATIVATCLDRWSIISPSIMNGRNVSMAGEERHAGVAHDLTPGPR